MIDFVTVLVNLLLVFVILFIYRQYDRRSRALDKIKKFIDIAKDNLEDFIDEKTKEINNLAVDMEAYQRSSIEIIKKIDEVQRKIKDKSNDFAEVEKKIAYHDSMLKELDDMALKVQDNIQRLQVDGKIVDKLSKTLKNFNTQIDSIDSRLSTVFEKFDKTNKENLETIKIESWDKFDNTIKDFSVRMDNLDRELISYQESLVMIEEKKREILDKGNEKLENEFKEFVFKIESSIDNYNKSMEDSFGIYETKYKSIENSLDLIVEQAKTKINDKEDFILTRLNEELQIKFDEVFMYVDERSHHMRDKLESKLVLIDNEISSLSSVFKDNTYSRLNSLEETIRQEMRQYEEQFADILEQFRVQIESSVGDIYKEYDSKINQFDKDIRDRIESSLKDANSRIESVQGGVRTLLDDLEEDSNRIYVEFKEKVKGDIDSFSENVFSRMNDVGSELELKLSNISTDIQDRISKLDSSLYSELKEMNEKFVNDYSCLDGNINLKYETLLEALNLKSGELEIQLKDKYKNIADKFEHDIDKLTIKCDEKFSRISEKSDYDYQNFEITSTKLKESISSLNDLLVQDFETLRRDFESKLSKVSADINDEVFNLKSHYGEDIGEFIKQMEADKLQYEHWQRKVGLNLEDIKSYLNKTNEEFLNLIEKQRTKGKELSENIFNELSEHIQKKAMDMHTNWKDELIVLNKSLLDVKISSEELLLSTSSKIDSFEKDVNERLEYVTSKTEDFESSVLDKYKELRDMSYNNSEETLSGIKEFIDNQAEIIHDKIIMMLNGLNEDFSNKEELIKGNIEELDYRLKDFKVECEDVLNNLRSDLDGFIEARMQKVSEIKIDNQKQIDNFLNRISEDILSKRDMLNSEVDNKLNDWQGKLSEISVNIENVLSSGKIDINSINSEMTLKIEDLKSTFEGLESYYLEKIDEFRNQGNVYADELLKNIMSHFDTDTKDLEESLSKKFATVLERSEEFVKEVDSLLKDKRTDIASFQASIDITIDSLNSRFNDVNREINEKYSKVISDSRGYSETLANKLENEIGYEIENVNRRLTDKIDILSKNMDENLENFKSSFDVSKYQVENFEIKIKDIIEKEELRLGELLREIERQYRIRREEAIDYKKAIDSDIIQLREQFIGVINELKNNIEDKSEFLNDLYKERFKIIENNFEERYSTFFIESEGAISKIRDEIYKILTDNDEHLRAKISEMDRNFEIIDGRSKEILELEEDLRKRIQEDSNNIHHQFDVIKSGLEKEIKDHFDMYMIKATAAIDEEIEKYERGINEKISVLKSIENNFEMIEKNLKDKISECHNELDKTLDVRYAELEGKYDEKHLLVEKKINDKTNSVEELIASKYAELEGKYDEKHLLVEKKINDKANSVEELIASKYAELEGKYDEKHLLVEKKINDKANSVEELIASKYAELEGKYDEKHLLVEKKINDKTNSVEELIASKYAELEGKYDEKHLLVEKKINDKANSVEELIASKYAELDSKYSNMHLDMENRLNACISDLGIELARSSEKMDKEIEEQLKNLGELKLSLSNIEGDVLKLKEDSYHNVSSYLKLLEEDFFKDLKERSDNLKNSLENFVASSDQRIENLERHIIKSLEDKEILMKNFRVEIEQELMLNKESFYSEFNKEFDVKKRDAESKIVVMETNVTNRIDEFIQLVDNRQNNVDSWFLKVKDDMINWQENAYKELEERAGITKRSLDKIKSDVSAIESGLEVVKDDVNQRTKEIFDRLQADIKEFENRSYLNLKNISNEVQGKVLNIEDFMDFKIKSINDKIDLHVEELATQVEIKFLSQQKDIEDKIIEANEKLEYEFNSMASRLDEEKQNIVSKFLNDTGGFESQVQLMQDDVLKLAEKVHAYRIDIEKTIRENYDSFSSSIREEYTVFENEVKSSLNYSEEEIQALRDSLKIQVNSIESEFKDKYDLMIKGIDDRVSQLKLKVLNYDGELNHFIDEVKDNLIVYKADLREELDSRYAVMSSKLENFKRLEVELERNNELMKEVYYFKNNLEELRGTLASEINLIQGYKGDFEGITREIGDIKSKSSDIIEVFNDLKDHQMDIEGIKKDLTQFLEFYTSFKERYKKLTESYDEMQIYKTKLKEIKEAQSNILDNYDRISNKDSILKSTLESVDKNFDLINEIESRMHVLFKESSGFQQSLGELKGIMSELLVNKDLSQEVLNNVQTLKEMLGEIESKLEHTRNIREKVAKSETRLENLNIAAEERIKTLGILVKTESKYKDNVGLNNETVRDSVIKLMRQGWSALEISRATKLSIGEVELILELGIISKSDD
ncbi:SpiroCoCo family coiled-coil protein [Borrelia parkeri]|uniref:SpiroCoCo family coiled-coil protein n=1 Tax=Borrelia parkeri TaxID=141 RepID=UPI0003D95AD0|nr:membrane protein [Borrelia parkeri]AHE62832.1 membrane protein [Borrelia parkeri HR1]